MGANSNKKWFSLLLLLLLLITQEYLEHADAGGGGGSVVEFLPGFQGPLPFQLETGYVGVDEGEDVQVFYYFVQSESNPKEDPLLLWITGGPGCSSLTGLLYEIGPIMFKMVEYNGTLPTLLSNPNSWTKGFIGNERVPWGAKIKMLNKQGPQDKKVEQAVASNYRNKAASIIFVDLPIGSGFTYTKTSHDSTDLLYFHHAYEFIRKWLSNHPEFNSNPFYLGGDSYTGIPVPIVAQLISNGNEAGVDQFINLKGYVLGNPSTNPLSDPYYRVEFAHGMGLIPDELYESLKTHCGGEYREEYVDPNNFHCLQNLKAYDECTDGILFAHILEPDCGYLNLRTPSKSFRQRRALDERINELYNAKQSLSAFSCRNEGYVLSYYWANDKSVRDALHIKKGSIGEWIRCNRDLTGTISDVRSYHLNLSRKGYRALIYSGDHDMLVTHQATQAWIKEMNYSIVDEWRSWKVNGQIAGYTRSYANNMTFATVKGGGHTAPEYRPEECLGMFQRWISHEPL